MFCYGLISLRFSLHIPTFHVYATRLQHSRTLELSGGNRITAQMTLKCFSIVDLVFMQLCTVQHTFDAIFGLFDFFR